MKKLFALVTVALALAGCQAFEQPAVSSSNRLTAVMESSSATKTSFAPTDGGASSVLWSAGDQIGVFIDNQTVSATFTLIEGAGSKVASFEGEGYGNRYVAVYPESIISSRNGDVLNIELPREQNYVPGGFDENTFPMVAVSNSSQLQFRNLCSIVKVSLKGNALVTKIHFSPNSSSIKVSGPARVDLSDPDDPVLTMSPEGSSFVTLNVEGGVRLKGSEPTDFYLVVPPQTYTGGLTIAVENGYMGVAKIFINDNVLERSKMHKAVMDGVNIDDPPLPPPTLSNYLTFTSEGTTRLEIRGSGSSSTEFYYSFDKNTWSYFEPYTTVTFSDTEPLYVYGNNPSGINQEMYSNITYFEAAGDRFRVDGDIMSLIDGFSHLDAIPCENCFNCLFQGCKTMTSGPDLPATTLTESCYERMFASCKALEVAPALPAMELAEKCYAGMFIDCSSLSEAPELPAVDLAPYCYASMFGLCTSLESAPVLPSTAMEEGCYAYMFEGCTNLIDAPVLPAEDLGPYCYAYMFSDCHSLGEAPKLPATDLASGCYEGMFMRCYSLNFAPPLLAETLVDNCYELMFYKCNNLIKVECLATDISADRCTRQWLEDVASVGNFCKPASMEDWPSGVSGIPDGWTIIATIE